MKKKLRNIYFKNVVLEILGITLILYGLNRLIYFVSIRQFEKKIGRKFNNVEDFLDQLSYDDMANIIMSQALIGFLGLLVVSGFLIFIRFKTKSFYLRSIVIFIFILIMYPFFIHRGIINDGLYYVSRIWETNFQSMPLISFIIFTSCGSTIIWKTINDIEVTTHNNGYKQ